MNNTFKVAIVGGGSAGLLCAIELLSGDSALLGEEVVVLERNDRVGKKLKATGNGQGNLTNKVILPENYHGDKGFIRAFFGVLEKADLNKYLENLGVFLTEGDDGKMFPTSFQAGAVLDIFRSYLYYKGCNIITDFYVSDIGYDNGRFILSSTTGEIIAENVVCAFGGSAGKQYGTDGSSYKLLEKFGHKTTRLYPSLVQLKANLNQFKNLKGVKERVRIKAISDEGILSSAEGDLLFTDYGISGSAVFKISGMVQGERNAQVSIEFLPDYSKDKLVEMLDKKLSLEHIDRTEVLTGIVNKQIGKIITRDARSSEEIADKLKDFRLEITGTLGFNYAQVTRGGIDTNSVNPFTFQSKLVKNLYLTGELLAIDGDCGGYNLTFAFVSGIASAKNIKMRCTKEK